MIYMCVDDMTEIHPVHDKSRRFFSFSFDIHVSSSSAEDILRPISFQAGIFPPFSTLGPFGLFLFSFSLKFYSFGGSFVNDHAGERDENTITSFPSHDGLSSVTLVDGGWQCAHPV